VLIVYKNTGHSYFTATFLHCLSALCWFGIHHSLTVVVYWANHLYTPLPIWGCFGNWCGYPYIPANYHSILVSRWKELPITKKDEETYSPRVLDVCGRGIYGLVMFPPYCGNIGTGLEFDVSILKWPRLQTRLSITMLSRLRLRL
jgi:cytochrome c-type biogenesis protein CcmF